MTYPIAVISIAAIVVLVHLWKVIRRFAALFAGLGRNSRCRPRSVIWLSNSVVRLMPFIVAGVIGRHLGIRQYLRHQQRPSHD